MRLSRIISRYKIPAKLHNATAQGWCKARRLVFVGYTPRLPIEVVPHELVRGEFEVFGSCATTEQELAAQGRVMPIIAKSFSLEYAEDAFGALRNGESLDRNVIAVWDCAAGWP